MSISLFPYVDAELFWRATAAALPQALVAAALLMGFAHLADMSVDRETSPSAPRLVLRCALAFFVPYAILMAGAMSSQMPSDYRRYGTGTYEAGKDVPAISYAISAGGNSDVPSAVSLRRDTADGPESASVAWEAGTVFVTLYEGDVMTITDGVAASLPSSPYPNPDAPTAGEANGIDFLLAGSALRPGTYELVATGDGAEYEVRDSFLETGYQLSPTGFTDMAYVDLHYGQVLYVKDAAFRLYSDSFGNGPHPDEDAAGDEAKPDEGSEAPGNPAENPQQGEAGVEVPSKPGGATDAGTASDGMSEGDAPSGSEGGKTDLLGKLRS